MAGASEESESLKFLQRYKRKIQETTDEDRLHLYLRRLKGVQVGVVDLHHSDIGTTVGPLTRRDDKVGQEASELITKWMAVIYNEVDVSPDPGGNDDPQEGSVIDSPDEENSESYTDTPDSDHDSNPQHSDPPSDEDQPSDSPLDSDMSECETSSEGDSIVPKKYRRRTEKEDRILDPNYETKTAYDSEIESAGPSSRKRKAQTASAPMLESRMILGKRFPKPNYYKPYPEFRPDDLVPPRRKKITPRATADSRLAYPLLGVFDHPRIPGRYRFSWKDTYGGGEDMDEGAWDLLDKCRKKTRLELTTPSMSEGVLPSVLPDVTSDCESVLEDQVQSAGQGLSHLNITEAMFGECETHPGQSRFLCSICAECPDMHLPSPHTHVQVDPLDIKYSSNFILGDSGLEETESVGNSSYMLTERETQCPLPSVIAVPMERPDPIPVPCPSPMTVPCPSPMTVPMERPRVVPMERSRPIPPLMTVPMERPRVVPMERSRPIPLMAVLLERPEPKRNPIKSTLQSTSNGNPPLTVHALNYWLDSQQSRIEIDYFENSNYPAPPESEVSTPSTATTVHLKEGLFVMNGKFYNCVEPTCKTSTDPDGKPHNFIRNKFIKHARDKHKDYVV